MNITKIIRKIQFISIIVSLVVLAMSHRLSCIPAPATLKYVNNEIVSHSWHDFYTSIVVVIMLVQLALYFALIIADIVNKIKNRVKICSSVSFTVFLVLFSYITSGFSLAFMDDFWTDDDYYPQCYMFTDNNHTIVIEERSFLLYGGGTIYQIHDNNKASVIGSISTDDGGRNHGRYDIEWSESGAEITYDYCDTEHSRQTEKVYFK